MQLSSWLQSSQDPTKVSKTVENLTTICSSAVVLLLLQSIGIHINANDIGTLITEGGVIVGAIGAIAGAIRKILIRIGSIKAEQTTPIVPPVV